MKSANRLEACCYLAVALVAQFYVSFKQIVVRKYLLCAIILLVRLI